MTAFTAREVRTWALANDVDCPRTGKVPQRVIDAYLLAVHGVTAHQGDPVDDSAAEEQPSDGDAFTVNVTIDAADSEAVTAIAQHLVEALWASFEAGRAAERARMLAVLGGAA